MKLIYILFIILGLQTLASAQINNGNFNYWTIDTNGYEIPEFWQNVNGQFANLTNAIVKVNLDDTNFALRLASEIPFWEGNPPTYLLQNVVIPGNSFTLNFDYKIENIYGSGNAKVFILLTVNSNIPKNSDSLAIVLVANVEQSGYGYWGYSSVLFDNIGTTLIDTTVNTLEHSEIKFEIYPNPAHEMLTINSADLITSVSIIDLSGQIVDEIFLQNFRKNILVHTYPSGLYFMAVETNKGKFVQSFVIE